MDSRLRERMCSLPTKQDPDSQEKNTALLHYYKGRHSPISTNRNGSYYGTSSASWTQRNTNHSGPWMLTHSHLPPMFRHHHRPRNCPTLPRLHLPMVWSTNQNDKRPRPQIYFAIRQGAHRKTRHPVKPIHSIPSPNRRPIGTKEPVD